MRKPVPIILAVLLAGAVAVAGLFLRARAWDPAAKGGDPVSYRGKSAAPEFPKGMQWLNTDRPVTLAGLRGKVVILDFWTYCCINCMHVLPDLQRLERKYPGELVVIGVHSAKFSAEQETGNVRQAILRYGIEHPVVNDKDMEIWQRYSVHAWPTLFLIDPDGRIVGSLSGEGIYGAFDELIAGVVREFDREGRINRKPAAFRLERTLAPKTMLSFPGKVLADAPSGRLFIADSNHNRIVVASLDGAVKETIGSGEPGLKDGAFAEARFNNPQGMALSGETLFVADTGNHAVRRVDLAKRTVTTLAGTAEQVSPRGSVRGAHGILAPGELRKGVPLNSPWDLVTVSRAGHAVPLLYVAMAGPHQLWVIDPETGEAGPCAGSGREGRRDGALAEASLAQPSGITTDGSKLYFADSEASSIRSADLRPNGRVETIVGLDLFEFGDRDGEGGEVRLQHPLGVAFQDGLLYVADTYNNKVKVLDPKTRRCQTLFGTGEEGLRDGDSAQFNEPGGLSVAGNRLYVADTNNHVIRVADLKTNSLTTLKLTGIPDPK